MGKYYVLSMKRTICTLKWKQISGIVGKVRKNLWNIWSRSSRVTDFKPCSLKKIKEVTRVTPGHTSVLFCYCKVGGVFVWFIKPNLLKLVVKRIGFVVKCPNFTLCSENLKTQLAAAAFFFNWKIFNFTSNSK